MKISKELRVGLFMVIIIAILYLGFNYLKGIDFFSSNDKYYAMYENVDGLNVSNPVYINGFVVGRVSDIRLAQSESLVLVELDIDGTLVLGDSATATLNGDFLGNKSILLWPGHIDRPIEPGDTIIARLDRAITDILAESAQPVANNIEATIKKVNGILDQLGGTGGKIDSILNNFHKTSVQLNTSIVKIDRNLDSLIAVYQKTGRKVNSTLEALNPTLANMEIITDSLKQVDLNTTVQEAKKTMIALNEAIDKFSNNKGTLGKLMTEDSLYVNLNNAVKSLDELLIHLDTQPKHFFSPLGKSAKKIRKDQRKAEEEN